MPLVLSPDVTEFLESGVSILVGSRDHDNKPECVRGLGAAVSPDRSSVKLFLHEDHAKRLCADFADNGRIAVAFSRFLDHKTLQLKGSVREVRNGTDADTVLQERYLSAFAEQISFAGLPASVLRRVRLSPAVVVAFDVEEIFQQTPGPDAGIRIEPRP